MSTDKPQVTFTEPVETDHSNGSDTGEAVTETITKQYHETKAAEGLTEMNAGLEYLGVDDGPFETPDCFYFQIVNGSTIEHDYAYISVRQLIKHILSSGVVWPENIISTIQNSVCTATDVQCGVHWGSFTLHSEKLPEPVLMGTDNWMPDCARSRRTRRRTQMETTNTEETTPDTPTRFEQKLQLANLFVERGETFLTGTLLEPSHAGSTTATYPLEVAGVGSDPTPSIDFRFDLPDTSHRPDPAFDEFVQYAGGSPEFLPDITMKLAPEWRVPEKHQVAVSGTGGYWALVTPEAADYITSSKTTRLWTRLTGNQPTTFS